MNDRKELWQGNKIDIQSKPEPNFDQVDWVPWVETSQGAAILQMKLAAAIRLHNRFILYSAGQDTEPGRTSVIPPSQVDRPATGQMTHAEIFKVTFREPLTILQLGPDKTVVKKQISELVVDKLQVEKLSDLLPQELSESPLVKRVVAEKDAEGGSFHPLEDMLPKAEASVQALEPESEQQPEAAPQPVVEQEPVKVAEDTEEPPMSVVDVAPAPTTQFVEVPTQGEQIQQAEAPQSAEVVDTEPPSAHLQAMRESLTQQQAAYEVVDGAQLMNKLGLLLQDVGGNIQVSGVTLQKFETSGNYRREQYLVKKDGQPVAVYETVPSKSEKPDKPTMHTDIFLGRIGYKRSNEGHLSLAKEKNEPGYQQILLEIPAGKDDRMKPPYLIFKNDQGYPIVLPPVGVFKAALPNMDLIDLR